MSWSKKYKKSIDCNNPKGFSQKAHCAGRKARQAGKSTKSKSVSEMTIEEKLELFLEKNCPTDKGKWAASLAAARSKFDVYPSAYANGWAAKNYKKKGGGWRKCKNESVISEDGCWDGYKAVGGKMKDGKMVPNCVPVNEASEVYTDWEENTNPDFILVTLKNGKKLKIEKKSIKGGQQMYRAILKAFDDENHKITDKIVNAMIKQLSEDIQELNCDENGNCWEMEPPRYQSTSMGYRELELEEIEEYDVETLEELKDFAKYIKEYTQLLSEATCPCLLEAEYRGRKVRLGKIMQGDVKKFKVYVKNPQGNVVKVNFGFGGKSAKGKRMVIKKNNPERRRNFRARHNCDNPGPRHKARYWACRTW